MPARELRSPNDSRPLRTVPLGAILFGAVVIQAAIVALFVLTVAPTIL